MNSIVLQETESRHAKVIEMIKAGKTNEEIKEVTGYSRSTIGNIMNEHGLQRMDIKREKVMEMYRNGSMVKEICAETGYKRGSVERIIKMNTIAKNNTNPATKEDIIELYKELKNYK